MRLDTDSTRREEDAMILKAVPCERCGIYVNKWGRKVVVTWTQNASGICRLHPIEKGDLVDVDLGRYGSRLAEVIYPADGAGNALLRSVEGYIFSAEVSTVSL
jgi:hypothetical protein